MHKTSKIGVPFKVRFFKRISLRIWHKNKSQTKNRSFSIIIFTHIPPLFNDIFFRYRTDVIIWQGFLLFQKAFDLFQGGDCKFRVVFWFQSRRDCTEFVFSLNLPLFWFFFLESFFLSFPFLFRSKFNFCSMGENLLSSFLPNFRNF